MSAAEPVATARSAIQARRQATGQHDVSQGDVDVAAEALIRAQLRPYPRLITTVTGGSLSTVTPMFDDWWNRFALRRVDPNSPSLGPSVKVALHVRLLIAQLEATVREQVRGVPDPLRALIAAAQVGEHQALQARVATLTAERDKLSEHLTALTYKVAKLEAQMRKRAELHTDYARQLTLAATTLESALTRVTAELEGLPSTQAVIEDLVRKVDAVAAHVTRRRRETRVTQKRGRQGMKRKSASRAPLKRRAKSHRIAKSGSRGSRARR
jgi:hypothetical protein